VGWAAGGFSSTDYNLTMTLKGSNGSFTDQEIVKQCLVGTRSGNATAGPLKLVTAAAPSQSAPQGSRLVAVACLGIGFAALI
jgi:hypothetical protein